MHQTVPSTVAVLGHGAWHSSWHRAMTQRALATDRPTEVHCLPGGHSPFLTRPEELAEPLASSVNRI
ncbi:hypothetical protein AB0B12_21645 [Streptomyces sp. NPDC044780]|uniref:hypothetical protein n=1 Tax=unclassified Streptomyces TaxID=2593676 RepID=UPI0033F8E644